LIKHPTSIPVDASMSRNTSTKFLTSFAAFAFDTILRNGLMNLISPPSSNEKKEKKGKEIDNSWLHTVGAVVQNLAHCAKYI